VTSGFSRPGAGLLSRRRIDRPSQGVYNVSMKFHVVLLAILACLASSSTLPGQTKISPKDLPPEFRKWLEEDVVYIITPKEKDVFLRLESDRDRNLFIEAFWKQRDPDPATEENEFRKEHYSRIQHANQFFGKDAPGPGWKSDMGRVYIILGPPKSVEKFESLYDIKPTIIWFYSDMAQFGLPNSFNVVFFKRDEAGDYRLYSPINDGPQGLLVHYMGDMTSYSDAYNSLMGKEPAIANVSLSLIPGESRQGISPSIPSEILLNKQIPAAAFERVKDDYAEKLLHYKDVIDVDYTANYIDSNALIKVYRDPSGQTFVHYLIEPSRLTFQQDQHEFRADLEVNGIVRDDHGNAIYQFDRAVPIQMGPDQFEKIKAYPFSFQDLFPLAPGKYSLSILWKNRLTKAFTAAEAELLIPEPDAFWMSSPVLAYRVDRESRFKGTNKSFLLGDVQFVPTSGQVFQSGETVYLFFQLNNLPEAVRTGGSVVYTILRDGVVVRRESRELRDVAAVADFVESFSLVGYSAAHYDLNISVLNPDATERLVSRTFFDITPLAILPRPWVISLPLPATTDPLISNILGNQYLQKNELAKARPLLESAHRQDPESVPFARDLCKALVAAKDYAGVKRVASPYLANDRKFEFLQIMGDTSRALGEYAEAIGYYKDYLSHFGMNILVLNGIGHCQLQLGNTAEALYAFEKSLEINPKQEDLQTLVKSLKEKK
jgi:GWxTD domain-containing protein